MTIQWMSTDRTPAPDIEYHVRLWDELPDRYTERYVPQTKTSVSAALVLWNWARSPHFTQRVGKDDLLVFAHKFDLDLTSTALSRLMKVFIKYECRKQMRISTNTGFQRCYMFLQKEDVILAAEQSLRQVYTDPAMDLTPFTSLEWCRNNIDSMRMNNQ